jgi:hypothetical protein
VSTQDDISPQSTGNGLLDDDELSDILDTDDADIDDIDDDVSDLEDLAPELGENVLVQQFEPESMGFVDDGVDPDLALEMPDDDEDLAGEESDEELLESDEPATVEAAVSAAPAAMSEQRLARLEETARALAQAEVDREQGRVRRKVKAATTGAGAIGFVPILLQLAGAVDLNPELAATASTSAAILGALVAGWATPERPQLVAATPAAQDLLGNVPEATSAATGAARIRHASAAAHRHRS